MENGTLRQNMWEHTHIKLLKEIREKPKAKQHLNYVRELDKQEK